MCFFQILDAFLPCIWDINKETTLLALECLLKLTHILHEQLKHKLDILVNGLETMMNSGNTELKEMAGKLMDSLVDHLCEYQDELIEL